MAISPAVVAGVPYVTLRDFAPISMIASFPLIMVVNPDHPAKSVKELVAWAKANPDKANYATSSPAFTLATELFKLKSGAPYGANPLSQRKRVGGERDSGAVDDDDCRSAADHPAGDSRQGTGLAVTAAKRLDDLPDVPTMDEQGYPDVHVQLWSGIFAPAKTPPAVIKTLETELQRIMQMPDVKERFKADGDRYGRQQRGGVRQGDRDRNPDVGRRRQGGEPQVRAVSSDGSSWTCVSCRRCLSSPRPAA